jgi:hypothetical protein
LKALNLQLIVIALLISALNGCAPVNSSVIDMEQAKKGRRISSFPFDKIQVLDNRFDTACIYTEETGAYPPHTVSFTEPAARAIEKYFYRVVSKSKKGNKEPLFNIEQLQIPNVVYTLKKFKRTGMIGVDEIRARILFEATAWYKTSEGLQALLY